MAFSATDGPYLLSQALRFFFRMDRRLTHSEAELREGKRWK